jgi:CRP-like cAMP-binding protein
MSFINLFRNEKDVKVFAAGEVIFNEGESANSMFVILEGTVEISTKNTVINTLDGGELLGEMALVDGTPRSASAVAKTECKLVQIDERRFLYMVQETPFFSLQVMRVIAKRLRALNEFINAQ